MCAKVNEGERDALLLQRIYSEKYLAYQVKKNTNTTSLFFLLFLFCIPNKLISKKGNGLVNVTTIPRASVLN